MAGNLGQLGSLPCELELGLDGGDGGAALKPEPRPCVAIRVEPRGTLHVSHYFG